MITNYEPIIENTSWLELKKELSRDIYILIHPDLYFKDAARAVVSDDKALVEMWLDQKKMVKPTLHQINSWDQTPEKPFLAFIAHPYVLIQEELS